ncbi:MAG: hypothetical protein LBM73_00370 [Candidatus Nomurabacteria bacterium]|jgi:hypothetical protein|nr:hypothetical protein [Candidatus Nomurabacteria bacterium]
MGLFVTDDNDRSELQRKLTAELREKAERANGGLADYIEPDQVDLPDGVEDSRYAEEFQSKPVSGTTWAWIGMGVGALAIIIWAIVALS